jgi:hypothetical protein
VTREEHLRAIKIIASKRRGKRIGLLALCSGPDCDGAEVWIAGISIGDAVDAGDKHIAEVSEE